MLFIKNNKMDLNTYTRSWGVCSSDIKSDLHGITDFLNDELTSTIELAEYKRYLMIITNNCNGYIDNFIKIKKEDLESAIEIQKEKDKEKEEDNKYHDLVNIVYKDSIFNSTLNYKLVFEKYNLLNGNFIGKIFRLYYNNNSNYIDVHLDTDKDGNLNIMNQNNEILNDKKFLFVSTDRNERKEYYYFDFLKIKINNKQIADEYNKQNGGVLSKNKGKKGVYKSTKQKVSVIIDKKHYNKTVYKNSKGISYIRRNNEYKLLKKYKLSKL